MKKCKVKVFSNHREEVVEEIVEEFIKGFHESAIVDIKFNTTISGEGHIHYSVIVYVEY